MSEQILTMRDDGTIELTHHGIKGQKWGVENGPPYPLDDSISTGKRLRDIEERAKNIKGDKKKTAAIAIAGGAGVLAAQGGKSATEILSSKASVNDKAVYKELGSKISDPKSVENMTYAELDKQYFKELNKAKQDIDLSDIPDEVLRARVNRLQTEKQYKDLTITDVNDGRDTAKAVLGGVATAASLAATGLTIALLIKKLKDGKS